MSRHTSKTETTAKLMDIARRIANIKRQQELYRQQVMILMEERESCTLEMEGEGYYVTEGEVTPFKDVEFRSVTCPSCGRPHARETRGAYECVKCGQKTFLCF